MKNKENCFNSHMRFIFPKEDTKKAIYKPRDASNLSSNAFDFSLATVKKVNNVYDSHDTRTTSELWKCL